MDTTHSAIIALMKSAVTGVAEPLPEGFDLEQVEALVSKQAIDTLIYAGAVRCGIPKTLPVMQRLFQKYIQLMLRSEKQMAEAKKLFEAFDEKGIDYLPLKGVILKELYPAHELRYMGDADILIKPAQEKNISSTMESLHFVKKRENNHEYVWCNDNLYVELHKQLHPPEDLDFIAFWGDGWNYAEASSSHRFAFSDEINFVYIFTHFAKHYRIGGIGCRYVMDLWLYKRSHPEIDEALLQEMLAKLSLLDFYLNICKLLDAWFENAAFDEKTEFISEYIFSGGSWGVWTNQILSEEIRSKKSSSGESHRKFSVFLRRLFPPYSTMIIQYPVTRNRAYLLPIYWIIRIFDVLLFQRHRVKKTLHAVEIATDDNIKARYEALKYVGLEYDF